MGTEAASEVAGDGGKSDEVGAFAVDLRALRVRAGNPTLHALAGLTGVSKSVLSEAFAGKRLPTENTVSRLARVLGDAPQPWVERRRALAGRPAEPPVVLDSTGVDTRPAAVDVAPRTVRRRSAILSAVAAGLVGAGLASGAWGVALAQQPASTAPNALPFATGVDPMVTACRNDAVIAAAEDRDGGNYLVEMMYSTDCMAVWGRVTRYDEKGAENELGMTIYPKGEPDSDRAQQRIESGVQSVYTPMLVEPDVQARVCGVAWVTVDGARVDLSPALCV